MVNEAWRANKEIATTIETIMKSETYWNLTKKKS